jgi:YHS domain-containing protein
MSVFPSRPAAAICLLTGGAALISLAGLVWAQTPNESWPFDEHNPAPPKTAVQQRLEDLYRRDGRPLPDYMQKDGSSGQGAPSDPSQPSSDAAAQRNQRGAANSQGTVQQQLSDYYQSQGKSVPGAPSAGGSSSSLTRQAAMQRGQTSATAPAQGHWYDRINPFHKATPATQPQPQSQQVRSQYPASTGMAGSDANYATPYVHEAAPVSSPATAAAPPPAPPASLPSPSGPAAKSSSFWGDLSLRRVPQQPTPRPSEAPIYVELGQGGKLVRKSAPAPAAPAAPGPAAPVPVVQGAPGVAHIAVVAPAVVALPAVPAAAPLAKKVSPADSVVSSEDTDMPFQASSEAEADQAESGPYTGLTLEEEQSQLTPPKPENAKATTPPAQHSAQAVASDAQKAQPAKAATQTQQPLVLQKQNDARVSARQSEARADEAPGHVSLPDAGHVSVPDSGHVALPDSDGPQLAGPTLPQPNANPEHPQPNAVAEHPHHRQTTAEKLRLIGERVGVRGLKGFCPVMLRDERELIDANPGYCSIYHGQRYCFSSSEAQARFDASPQKYAPVVGGMDVVVKINSDQAVEGTLDFALWYKDRLYLFCSPESLQAFTISPAAYAMAAQRIQ